MSACTIEMYGSTCLRRAEIPTIIDPSATINYPSATGSIIVGIKVCGHIFEMYVSTCLRRIYICPYSYTSLCRAQINFTLVQTILAIWVTDSCHSDACHVQHVRLLYVACMNMLVCRYVCMRHSNTCRCGHNWSCMHA